MDKTSLDEFLAALANPAFSSPVLVSALEACGIKTSVTTIRRWRSNGFTDGLK